MAAQHKHLPPHLQRPAYAAETNTPPSATPQNQPRPMAPQPPMRAPPAQPREQNISNEQLPRPTSNRYDELPGHFSAVPGQVPPPALVPYSVKEYGVSGPRHLRLTSSFMPFDENTLQATGLPFAALWTPLAELQPGDDPVPVVAHAPCRCSRCFGYINAHFRFIEGDRKMVCNLCGLTQDTPELYLAGKEGHPELSVGTYEFCATAEYTNRALVAPVFYFCIDVSAYSMDSGLFSQVVVSIKSLLECVPNAERTRVGVMTFASYMTFYKITATGELAEVIVNDIQDPFVPDPIESLTFNVGSDREQAHLLLAKLAEWKSTDNNKNLLSCGSVIQAMNHYLLRGRGGRVIVFTTGLGTIGKNKLSNRNDPKVYNTEKEKLLYHPLTEYAALGHECTAADVCVDVFACARAYVDAASLAGLCSQTGGDFYLYSNFDVNLDGEKLYYQLIRILTRAQGFQSVMRARTSNGILIDNYIGKFKRRGPVEMEAACVHADQSILVVLKYDTKFTEDSDAHLQCAMLYTSVDGRRLIRVSNSVIKVSRNNANLLKGADQEVIANAYLKLSAMKVYDQSMNTVRESLFSNMTKLLYTHRAHSQEGGDSLRVLVPETMKYLPLYCCSALKLPAFSSAGVPVDLRMYSVHAILSMPLVPSRLLLYPLVFGIHDLEAQPHSPGTIVQDYMKLPNLSACSLKALSSAGVYLICNGELIVVYVGSRVEDPIVQGIWGLTSVEELKTRPEYWEFQNTGTEASGKVLGIVEELKRRNPGVCPVCYFIFEGDNMVKSLMVEDSTPNDRTYGDFLLNVHRSVVGRLAGS